MTTFLTNVSSRGVGLLKWLEDNGTNWEQSLELKCTAVCFLFVQKQEKGGKQCFKQGAV